MLSAVLAAPLELKHDKDVEVYTEQDLTTVRYSGDGRRVAAASFDGGITMWDGAVKLSPPASRPRSGPSPMRTWRRRAAAARSPAG